ncbi:MAG: DUF192 domain-containing protein [Christensenella sp.]|nr:DUF192 domain-containing protein [Christensenella sp.]
MKILQIRKNGTTIANVWHANGYFTRLRGLLGRTLDRDGGLMLSPCSSIHTIGMRYAIDAVYLDRGFRVLRVDQAIQPGKVCKAQHGARHILELPEGMASLSNISSGDILEVTHG